MSHTQTTDVRDVTAAAGPRTSRPDGGQARPGLLGSLARYYAGYLRFGGRADRLEFFSVMACLFLASCLMQFVFYQMGATGHLGGAGWLGYPVFGHDPVFTSHPDVPEATAAFRSVSTVLVYAHVLPTLALTARRLRDVGLSPVWTLLAFIPGLGSLVLLLMVIQPTGRRRP